MDEDVPMEDSSDLAKSLLGALEQDTGIENRSGVFVRGLEEEAFEEHLKSLGWRRCEAGRANRGSGK